jgi:bifunctional N-acetylglucosamine-1-phosphate-uridyltransferase/glucosamine-1-phosphate-acetyltransferase GlmU-like protein
VGSNSTLVAPIEVGEGRLHRGGQRDYGQGAGEGALAHGAFAAGEQRRLEAEGK